MIYIVKRKEEVFLKNENGDIVYHFPSKEDFMIKEGLSQSQFGSYKRFKSYKGYTLETIISKDTKSLLPPNRRVPGKVKPDEPGEIWKEVPEYPHNWCSNMGNFKIVDLDGQEYPASLTYSKNKNGRLYRDVLLVTADKYVRARTSRVILHTFVDNSFSIEAIKGALRVANHKNNKPEDETLDNLEIVSQKQNITKAVYESGSITGKKCQKVFAYNIRTNVKKDYPSCNKLAEDIFGKHNGGLFDYAYRHQTTTSNGWQVFKEGDSYPRIVKGKYIDFGGLRIFKAGFAFNPKSGRYVGSYSKNGIFLIKFVGIRNAIPLGKVIAALFNSPELISNLDSSTRLLYKDKNKENLFAGNLVLMKRKDLTEDIKKEYRIPIRTKNSKHHGRPKRTIYVVDTKYPGSDYQEMTVDEIVERFDTNPCTVRKYAKTDGLFDGRYLITYNELLALTFDFEL